MAKNGLTDEQVEQEIARLQKSPYVALANKERRVRNRRRMVPDGSERGADDFRL